MFIWTFAVPAVLNELLNWLYAQIVGFLGSFFEQMGNMGVELLELPWVQGITRFFSRLGWALFGVSLVVSVFESALEYNSGRGNLRQTALNWLKGLLAVSLFTTVPVRLYTLSVSLQGTICQALTNYGTIGDAATAAISQLSAIENLADLGSQSFMNSNLLHDPLMVVFCVIMMAYAVIKVFFANLKRGGILLVQISVGSLYMFSIARGYADGFYQWMKQVIGLCLGISVDVNGDLVAHQILGGLIVQVILGGPAFLVHHIFSFVIIPYFCLLEGADDGVLGAGLLVGQQNQGFVTEVLVVDLPKVEHVAGEGEGDIGIAVNPLDLAVIVVEVKRNSTHSPFRTMTLVTKLRKISSSDGSAAGRISRCSTRRHSSSVPSVKESRSRLSSSSLASCSRAARSSSRAGVCCWA